MTLGILEKYWALVIASILGLGIVLFVLYRTFLDSRRGRLVTDVGHLRQREQALRQASGKADKAAAKYARLSAKGDSIAPNKVLAAKDALVGAQETERLLKEQVLVVRNKARTIILEEYPPASQPAMLKKHLGESR